MNVFLAPGLFKNIKRSIIDGVKLDEMNVKDPLLRERILKRYGADVVRLWALKAKLYSRWTRINEGDYTLFYQASKIVYSAKVSFKYPFAITPEQVEVGNQVAENVWGRDVDGETWPYLFFLEEVREIELPLAKFNELTGYNLKAVQGFMKMREDAAAKLIEWLQETYVKPPIVPSPKPPESLQHDEIVDIIYGIGELIGYKPEKKWRHEGYEFDVVWHRPPRVGPKYVFEVHIKGSLEAALLRLKHAYDLWESQIFLVSTEDQLKEARSKFLGELHELKDKVTQLDVKIVKEFLDFKGKYEWLERKFGLGPT